MKPGKKLSLTSGPKKVEGWGRRLEGRAEQSAERSFCSFQVKEILKGWVDFLHLTPALSPAVLVESWFGYSLFQNWRLVPRGWGGGGDTGRDELETLAGVTW